MNITGEKSGRGRGRTDRFRPIERVTFCSTVTIDSEDGSFGEGGRSGGRGEEGVKVRCNVENVDFSSFGEGCDMVWVGRSGGTV